MAIAPGHTKNFETMRKAFANGDVALVECTDVQTSKPVVAVCMVNRSPGGEYVMVPVAKLFDGNPYHELAPPNL